MFTWLSGGSDLEYSKLLVCLITLSRSRWIAFSEASKLSNKAFGLFQEVDGHGDVVGDELILKKVLISFKMLSVILNSKFSLKYKYG